MGHFLLIILSASLSSVVFALPLEKSVIDIHSHIGCIGEKSDCLISRDLKKSFKFKFLLKSFGVKAKELEKEGDQLTAKILNQKVIESKYVKKVVVLALDGYIDEKKEEQVEPASQVQSKIGLDMEKTTNYIPNDFVVEMAKKYDTFYIGASINPNRKNALALLDKAASDGAVLIKLIPNIMGINLSNEKFTPFYMKLKEYNIPLLVHIGNETVFNRSEDDLGDPRLLELPLKLGVKVIGAHLGTTGVSDDVENFDHFLDLAKRYPNLYSDFSGMTNLNRKKYLTRSIKDESIASRIIYGSDYPLINIGLATSSLYQVPRIPLKKAIHLARMKNPFDRDIETKEYLGLKDINYKNYKDVLRIP